MAEILEYVETAVFGKTTKRSFCQIDWIYFSL